MRPAIQPADLLFFSTLVEKGSLSSAARELGITTAAASRRLAHIESRIDATLINRTTRRMSLTPEGEVYLEYARRILSQFGELDMKVRVAHAQQGRLRVGAPLRLGRRAIAPLIAQFLERQPDVQVALELSAAPVLRDDVCDVIISAGAAGAAEFVAPLLASGPRIVCAAPAYLARFGSPEAPADLARHVCIALRQENDPGNVWRLSARREEIAYTQSVKAQCRLGTNDEDVAVAWALAGLGLLMVPLWGVAADLGSRRLKHVMPEYRGPPAEIFAVYSARKRQPESVRTFVDFIRSSLPDSLGVSLG